MKLEVKLFARARDLAGAGQVQVELPETSRVADLREALGAQIPSLLPLVPSLLIAIGNDYADENRELCRDSAVAVFPPVSGG